MNPGLFQSIHQNFFEFNSSFADKSFDQLNDELDIYYRTYLLLQNLGTTHSQNKLEILKQLSDIKIINQYLNPNDLPNTKTKIQNHIFQLYEYLVQAYSVEKSILIYSNQSTDLIEKQFLRLHEKKIKFENQTHICVSQKNSFIEIDITDSIEHIIAKYYENIEKHHSDKLAEIDQLRDTHHMCLICNIFPAVYYATPCMHPCFCVNCMNDFAQKQFLYNRCLNCQSLVKSIETMSFIQRK